MTLTTLVITLVNKIYLFLLELYKDHNLFKEMCFVIGMEQENILEKVKQKTNQKLPREKDNEVKLEK
ncbi:hypothetical protein ACI3PL_30415, partial [Lacticaseibacillus paracasei]